MKLNFTKAILTLCVIAIFNITASAQYFSEDFEAGTGLPTGWEQVTLNTSETFEIVGNGYLSAQSVSCNYDAAVQQQDEWVITPSIDLSTATNPTLFFAFLMSNFWGVSPNDNYDLRVSVRTNGGAWTMIWDENMFIANGGEFTTFEYTPTSIDMGAYTGETDVQIGFQYLGADGATGGFDQISISEPIQNDMVLTDFAAAPAFSTPVGLAMGYEFGTAVLNAGDADQTNVTATLEISSPSAMITTETADYGTVEADSAYAEVFPLFTGTEVGEYSYSYAIDQDQSDEVFANNSASGTFLVSNDVWALDNGALVNGSAFPATLDEASWKAGNIFTVPDYAAGTEFYVTGASMALEGRDDVALNGKSYVLTIYKIAEDENPAAFTDDDLTEVAFGVYEYPAEGDYNLEVITAGFPDLLEPLEGDTIWLERNTEYFFTVDLDMTTGFAYSTNSYGYNRVATVLNIGGWFLGGFGDDLTGVFRLNVANTGMIDANEEILSDANTLNVFPNPVTSSEMTVSIELENAEKDVTLNILDMTGKLISTTQLQNVKNNQTQINVADLASGTYVLHMITSEGVKATRFNIVK